MQIKLDEQGTSLPDASVYGFIEAKINKGHDIHVSNMLAVDAARIILRKIEHRPRIEWVFYGEEVFFDDDMKTEYAYEDPCTNIYSQLTESL